MANGQKAALLVFDLGLCWTDSSYGHNNQTPNKGRHLYLSDFHASCPGLACRMLEPRRQMAGLGRSSKSRGDHMRLYRLNQGSRWVVAGEDIGTRN